MWEVEVGNASWIVRKILKGKQYLQAAGFQEQDLMQMDTFSIKKIYMQLRGSFPKVPWRKVVCNNYGSAKWIFILRLIICSKILTRDRLVKWSITKDTSYPLCNTGVESVEHLFFSCVISANIWSRILAWQGIKRTTGSWCQELAWALQSYKGNSATAEVYRICLAGTTYYIWQERNARVFQKKQRSVDSIVKQIVQDVHCRGIVSAKLKRKLDRMNFYP
ncbi:uncharacterized protein LOC132061438 [Lycium ferocissimum]|uniref:uncharacterized protein LOC132061438 n=1 Tax=Lycium ferocissimum TaxID=112874 RepID=UPI002814E8DC|nr:uncharacterized protein LOC132061438 [Lycium ferocissimum]